MRTARLELVSATPERLRSALEGTASLASALEASVPSSWPPEYLDAAALEFTLQRVRERPADAAWWMYFIVLVEPPRTLIGSCGYKGPPSPDGTVEVGYGIASEFRRRGFAAEATTALVDNAFALRAVTRVIAETLPELEGSKGVLRRCGFRFIGDGSEPGVLRYERARSA